MQRTSTLGKNLALAFLAAVAGATLTPARRLLGSTAAGKELQLIARDLPRQKAERGRTWAAAPSGPSLANLRGRTFVDGHGCAYHVGHDGRIRLGGWDEERALAGLPELPVDKHGRSLRGRARRRVLRRMKVQAQAIKRRPHLKLPA